MSLNKRTINCIVSFFGYKTLDENGIACCTETQTIQKQVLLSHYSSCAVNVSNFLLHSVTLGCASTLRGSKFKTCSPSKLVARERATYACPEITKSPLLIPVQKISSNLITLFEDPRQVNPDSFKSLTLGLVYTHSPCEYQGQLGKM